MEDAATVVQKFIIGNYMEPGMLKVVNVQATPAVPPGENFLSAIWRVLATILLENGEVRERNFIFKNLPEEQERRHIALQVNAFTKEIMMYEFILKKMDDLMSEFGDSKERPWCDFISHKNYETLLLQDLKPLGYAPVNKIVGLTLEEAKLVFRSLGSFHAASKLPIERGDIQVSLLKPRPTSYSPKHIELFIVRALRFANQSIEENWGPQWKDVAAKLNQPTEFLVNKMIDAGKMDESRFNAVLHADLWTNNILFKSDSSGVKDVKFVDFQLSFYNTVGWDLTYLAFTSLDHNLRKQHLNELLRIYSETLQEDLKRYGYTIEKIPTFEYILAEMKRLRFWALVTILFYKAVVLTGVTGNKQDSQIIMNPTITPTHPPEIYSSQIFRDAVSQDLLQLINEGVMD